MSKRIIVKVDACWGGGDHHYFRLTIPQDGVFRSFRESVPGEKWDRATATEALDLLENVYHLPRKDIRFHVR